MRMTPAGWLLYHLVSPSYRRACIADLFAREKRASWLADQVRQEIARRYRALSDEEKRQWNREIFWGGEAGVNWHSAKKALHEDPARFQEDFLRFRKPLADQIAGLVALDPAYHTLCHIGTGNGLFLDHLSRRLPGLKRFVGIDLSAEQIRINRRQFRGSQLEFTHAEASDWLRQEGRGGGVICVAVGTLQYFTPMELADFLAKVREETGPAAVGISETVNLDLSTAVQSAPRGEIGYSHPYPFIFRSAGYHLFQQEIRPVDAQIPHYDQMILVATTQPVPQPALAR